MCLFAPAAVGPKTRFAPGMAATPRYFAELPCGTAKETRGVPRGGAEAGGPLVADDDAGPLDAEDDAGPGFAGPCLGLWRETVDRANFFATFSTTSRTLASPSRDVLLGLGGFNLRRSL